MSKYTWKWSLVLRKVSLDFSDHYSSNSYRLGLKIRESNCVPASTKKIKYFHEINHLLSHLYRKVCSFLCLVPMPFRSLKIKIRQKYTELFNCKGPSVNKKRKSTFLQPISTLLPSSSKGQLKNKLTWSFSWLKKLNDWVSDTIFKF